MCQASEILGSHASPRNAHSGSCGLLRPRRGMTLLELTLALGLTAVILVLISQAVRLHLTVFDVSQSEVEQPQVARAVLRYIAADLRNAVRPGSADASGAGPSPTAASSGNASTPAASKSDSGSQSSTGSSSTQKPTASQNSSTSEDMSTTTSSASSVQPVPVPGLYGSQYELQIDVSRPPRVDQYTPSSAGATVDIPSDLKTVSYSLMTGGTTAPSAGTNPPGGEGTSGLFRRELDRAVANYASTGNSSSGDSGSGSGDGNGQLLAAEVNRLEFRYFDGSSWGTEWDSQQQGGLPLAVEITLGIDPAAGTSTSAGAATAAPSTASADADEFTYRLVVQLPVAEQITVTSESTSDTSTGLGVMEP